MLATCRVTGGLADDLMGGLADDLTGGLADDLTGGLADDLTAGLVDDAMGGLADDATLLLLAPFRGADLADFRAEMAFAREAPARSRARARTNCSLHMVCQPDTPRRLAISARSRREYSFKDAAVIKVSYLSLIHI